MNDKIVERNWEEDYKSLKYIADMQEKTLDDLDNSLCDSKINEAYTEILFWILIILIWATFLLRKPIEQFKTYLKYKRLKKEDND